MESVKDKFYGKNVLIFGLGLHGGGAGAASFFARLGAKVTVTDLKGRNELKPALLYLRRFRNISYVLGRHRAEDFLAADFIIKNPGVPDNSSFLKIARRNRIPILSDMEVFFRLCQAIIIGITGTKGKSTTAHLLSEFLKRGIKKKVWLAGNIRKSVLDILPDIKGGDIVVLELSSFQLDSLASQKLSPQIAVLTNIFPDHLNRYKDFNAYARSKSSIFKFQKKSDYLFLPKGDSFLRKLSSIAQSRRVFIDTKIVAGYADKHELQKFGKHQWPSVALAIAVARHLGVKKSAIAAVLKKSRQLEGRLEFIRNVGGVKFINDTTATNPTSAVAALRTIHEKNPGKIILIAGGSDKKLPSLDFTKAITKFVKAVVLLPGGATKKLESETRNQKPEIIMRKVKTMREAVRIAYGLAAEGDTVLLSPGAASFGLFKHEFDRGEQFVKAVRALRVNKKTGSRI